jgi:ATP-dependent RNA helicase RhlE
MTFSKYGFSAELLRGIKELGFKNPTPIQEQALPPGIEGRDLLACAMTGSGKSAAFGLPIIHRLADRAKGFTRALILTPTRELAAQIDEHLNALAVHTPISAAAIYGGVGMGAQEHALRRGTDIIVATPGRLLDHMNRPYANFKNLEVLVLDEADRMLDMGFLPDIRRILKYLPTKRQTLFFSATMPTEIAKLSREMLQNPFTISVERQSAPAAGITQAAYPVAQHLKPVLLTELMKRGLIRSVIVFTRTKSRANRLADYLVRMGVNAGRIHGDRSQSQRTETLRRFKEGKFSVLVATDIAARGIDVESLSHVVNFDIPPTHEDYIHRVGRTGRNQSQGDAFAFVSPEEEGACAPSSAPSAAACPASPCPTSTTRRRRPTRPKPRSSGAIVTRADADVPRAPSLTPASARIAAARARALPVDAAARVTVVRVRLARLARRRARRPSARASAAANVRRPAAAPIASLRPRPRTAVRRCVAPRPPAAALPRSARAASPSPARGRSFLYPRARRRVQRALASRRIRLSIREPARTLCGHEPLILLSPPRRQR